MSSEHDTKPPAAAALNMRGRWLVLALFALLTAGCAQNPVATGEVPANSTPLAQYEMSGLDIRVIRVLRAGAPGTLITDPGWIEYVFEIRNTSKSDLNLHNVKLLLVSGRYLDSANTYDQLALPPDAGSTIAGDVATRAAGVAVGQVIPFGGAFVGIFSDAASATSAESRAKARRDFELRKLKAVELAPGGEVIGSAFLPNATDAKALVLDYGLDGQLERAQLPVSRSRVR